MGKITVLIILLYLNQFNFVQKKMISDSFKDFINLLMNYVCMIGHKITYKGWYAMKLKRNQFTQVDKPGSLDTLRCILVSKLD